MAKYTQGVVSALIIASGAGFGTGRVFLYGCVLIAGYIHSWRGNLTHCDNGLGVEGARGGNVVGNGEKEKGKGGSDMGGGWVFYRVAFYFWRVVPTEYIHSWGVCNLSYY